MFRPMIRSRHGSHEPFRKGLQKLPFRSVIRLGSTTELIDTIANGGKRIECNTVEAVKNSSSKLRMKQCFTKGNVKTADWWTLENILTDSGYPNYFCNYKGIKGNKNTGNNDNCYHAELPYPIVAKSHFGSRGNGNYLIKSKEELDKWLPGKTLGNYIFERFYNYVREYRLHVTKDGCFYTCRKMLKEDTPEDKRWFRNDSNSVWIVEENEMFDRPVNWKTIEEECVKALLATGLDVGACDVKVQSSKEKKERKDPDFIIIEINSAPSMGDITLQRYTQKLPEILKSKHASLTKK
jgi:carbamoylphosphate synthase large subunit